MLRCVKWVLWLLNSATLWHIVTMTMDFCRCIKEWEGHDTACGNVVFMDCPVCSPLAQGWRMVQTNPVLEVQSMRNIYLNSFPKPDCCSSGVWKQEVRWRCVDVLLLINVTLVSAFTTFVFRGVYRGGQIVRLKFIFRVAMYTFCSI